MGRVGRRRGIAVTTVVAMLVVLVVVLFAVMKLVQLYAAVQASLASEAAASQQPTLVIKSVMTTTNGLNITVENEGNQPVEVKAAYLLTYGLSGSSTGAVNCTDLSTTYVPVGGVFSCHVPSSGALYQGLNLADGVCTKVYLAE